MSPGSGALAKDVCQPVTYLVSVKFAGELCLPLHSDLETQQLHQDEEMTSPKKLLIFQVTAGIWML